MKKNKARKNYEMKEMNREEILADCKEAGLEFKKNGEPKVPKKVRKPTEPASPRKTLNIRTALYSNTLYNQDKDAVSLKEILKSAKDKNIKVENIEFEINSEYDDCYDCSPSILTEFGFYYDEVIKNDRYEKELEQYNKKMKIYKVKLENYKIESEEYQKQFMAYNKWAEFVKAVEIDKEIAKLKKQKSALLG